MKRILSLLAAVLAAIEFLAPAALAAESTAELPYEWPVRGAQVLDVISYPGGEDAYIVLYGDRTVGTFGLEEYLSPQEIREIESWEHIRQIWADMRVVIGLKWDGTLAVSNPKAFEEYRDLQPEFDPLRWTNVAALVGTQYEFYGLTTDGRILVQGYAVSPNYVREDWKYLDWDGVRKVCSYVYPEDRALFALREDGTILRKTEYYTFSRPVDRVADIDSSGYLHVCVLEDGSVALAGVNTMGNPGLVEQADKLRGITQAVAGSMCVYCRQAGGRVYCIGNSAFPGTEDWQRIERLYMGNGVLLGLDSDGRVHAATGSPLEQAQRICSEVESWKDVVEICYRPNGFNSGYFLAWQSDGTLLTAGLDLPGLPR